MKDENFIVCNRVGMSRKPLIDGSIKERCSICKNEVWISPATIQSIKLGLYKGEIACVNCMNIKLDDSK